MKKVLAFIIAFSMIFSVVPSMAEELFYGDISVLLDGEKIETKDVDGDEVKPFISAGTTYLPIRAMAEAFGFDVDWDNDTRSVVIGKKGAAEKGEEINILIDGEKFIARDADGDEVYPKNVNNSVFLPVRAIAEAFGKNVSWDQSSLTVSITTPKEKLGGKYYVITNKATGKAVAAVDFSAENGAALTCVEYDAVTPDISWRLGKMGDGVYNLSNEASGKSIDVPSASLDAGKGLIIYTTNGNNNQKWIFTEVEDGVYEISVSHSKLYMDASGETLVQAERTGGDTQRWTLTYAGDSQLNSVLDSEGYKLLSKAEQNGFERYMFGSLPACYAVANSAESYLTEHGYENASPQEQAAMLKTVLSYTAYGQVTGDKFDQTSAEYKIVKEYVDDNYDIWRGAREKCWIYEVEMEGDVEGVIHKFTMVSNEENSEMPQRMIEALGTFPYAVRQYVTRLIWKWGDNANNYNGGGNTIWARLNWKPSKNQIIQTLSHELGHILDSNQLEDMMIWSHAEVMDAVPVSGYGSSNQAEDLAEMHRLYWTTLDKDTQNAVDEVYPNRLAVLKGLLYRADKEHFAEFAQYEKVIEEIKKEIDSYGNAETASELDMSMYYSIVDEESNLAWTIENASTDNQAKVVLEEYTGADNQKFSVETFGGLVRFYNKNSSLPIQLHTSAMVGKPLTQYGGTWAVEDKFELEKSGEGYILKSKRYGLSVNAVTVGVGENFKPFAGQDYKPSVWKITPVEKGAEIKIYNISVNDMYLDGESALALTEEAGSGALWILQEVEDGIYAAVNTASGKSIDINGASSEAGAKLIIYDQTKNGNQCFAMEETEGGFLLKMAHSSLYLTYNDDGTVTQEERDEKKAQIFVFTEIE